MISPPFIIHLPLYRAGAWACTAVFTGFTVLGAAVGEWETTPVFLLFTALGIYLLLAATHLELDGEAITVVAPRRRYRIGWNEVESVEYSALGTMVFRGRGDKRLVYPATAYWPARLKPAVLQFLAMEMNRRGIGAHESPMADYRWHRNVRVPD